MTYRAPPQDRQLTLFDCLFTLGMLVGAASGLVLGAFRYGILGAILGVPIGAVLGFLGTIALVVALGLMIFGVLSLWAFVRHGRRGVAELFREGPGEDATGEAAADSNLPSE